MDAAVEEVEVDPRLAFLDGHVAAALQDGAAPYLSETERASMGLVRQSAAGSGGEDHLHQLRFAAYDAPSAAAPPAALLAASLTNPAAPSGDATACCQSYSRCACRLRVSWPTLMLCPA